MKLDFMDARVRGHDKDKIFLNMPQQYQDD